jgi:hypothetical protein
MGDVATFRVNACACISRNGMKDSRDSKPVSVENGLSGELSAGHISYAREDFLEDTYDKPVCEYCHTVLERVMSTRDISRTRALIINLLLFFLFLYMYMWVEPATDVQYKI